MTPAQAGVFVSTRNWSVSNSFNRFFFQQQKTLAKIAGEVATYHAGETIIEGIPVVMGDKSVVDFDSDGSAIQYKQLSIVVDAAYLPDVEPASGHSIVIGSTRYNVIEANGKFYSSTLPTEGAEQIYRIYVVKG